MRPRLVVFNQTLLNLLQAFKMLQEVLGSTVNGTTYAGIRARTTGAPQNHWYSRLIHTLVRDWVWIFMRWQPFLRELTLEKGNNSTF